MKRLLVAVMVLCVALAFAGCAKKKVVAEPPAKMEEPAKAEAAKPAPAPEPAPKEEAVKTEAEPTSLIAKAEAPEADKMTLLDVEFKDAHFDFDRYDLNEEAKGELKKAADWMTKNPGTVAVVEGHCDDRGTNEYNLALGDRRANSIKQYLVALGIPPDRVETISYGEEKPACTEQNEECWFRNRRGHIVMMKRG